MPPARRVVTGAELGPVLPELPNQWELAGRIVLAALLGGLIGLERELSDHPSGLRTHITVAIGAALFGLCSAYAFAEFIALRNDNNYQVDVTRVASQVVVGVGFLGGGAIIKQGNTVRGLTSAAGIWVSAAIGLAVALGLYAEAATATFTLLGALTLLKKPRRFLRKRLIKHKDTVVISLSFGADAQALLEELRVMDNIRILHSDIRQHEEDGVTILEAEIETRGGMLEARLEFLEGRVDVLGLEVS